MSIKKSSFSLPYLKEEHLSSEKKIIEPKNSPSESFRKINTLKLNLSNSENRTIQHNLFETHEPNNLMGLAYEKRDSYQKSPRKFINIPDFYMGTSLNKVSPQYPLSKLLENYNKTIKFVDEMDSKNMKLSRETYYSGYEKEILNSVKNSERQSQTENQTTGIKLILKYSSVYIL